MAYNAFGVKTIAPPEVWRHRLRQKNNVAGLAKSSGGRSARHALVHRLLGSPGEAITLGQFLVAHFVFVTNLQRVATQRTNRRLG
ncbi:hypothetical protein SAMN06265222_108212 [Neorhodopirellula lusitana]|uniref:Uncharacterized protein n=1 Tax=Neorhodopirellula lusitana TaxID=445327 RepID=A0ABY1QAK5_9BACT|nr:hypothetical protein SAMN06265222_108212 [Neorhodopirellula lusitana]